MNATDELPVSYRHCYTLSPNRNRLAQGLLILAALGAFVITWQLIRWVSPVLLHSKPTGFPLIDRHGIWLVVIAIILLHENVHALVAWRFIRRWPSYGISPIGVYINISRWYLPRSSMIAVSVAPLLFLSLFGLLLLVILPPAFARWLVLFILLNAAGSINDLAVAAWAFFQPDSALIQNTGRDMQIYRLEGELLPPESLRDRIRVLLERLWIKADRA